jgi:hypothetical protein
MLVNLPTWVQNQSYVEGVLISLQNSVDENGDLVVVDSSLCTTSYRDFYATVASLDSSMDEAIYTAARVLKGQGPGTTVGLAVSNFGLYQQLVVSAFDCYNGCSLDYYMVAVGSSVQNPSGLANLVTNLAFRAFSEGDTTLADFASALVTYD